MGCVTQMPLLLREIRRSRRSCPHMCPSSQTHSPVPRAGRWAAGWTRPWGEPSPEWTSSLWKAPGRGSWTTSCSLCRDLMGGPQQVGRERTNPRQSSEHWCLWLSPTWGRRRIPETLPGPQNLSPSGSGPQTLERDPSVEVRSLSTEVSLTS